MDEGALYGFCHQAIGILLRNGGLSIDDCKIISEEYARAIFSEMRESSATISQDSMQIRQEILQVNGKEAKKLYDNGYYIRKSQDCENNKRLLLATEESAKAANRSADSAEKANEIAKQANKKATIANIIAIIAVFVTIILNIRSNVKNDSTSHDKGTYSADTISDRDTLQNSLDTCKKIKVSSNYE